MVSQSRLVTLIVLFLLPHPLLWGLSDTPAFMNSSTLLQHSPTSTTKTASRSFLGRATRAISARFSSSKAVVNLAQELIRIPSVTPQDLGCQDVVRQRLEKLGFACETLQYNDVTNLWAVLHPQEETSRTGEEEGKLITFLGHTDVVPPGPVDAWNVPPFEGKIVDNVLYGRGAVDMKGGVAAYIVALERFLEKYRKRSLPYSLGVLLTSDEEGTARWGTREVMRTLQERGVKIDMAIVGEPSSLSRVGDVIKVGRRGSLDGDLSIIGIQGHVAYPHLARNPIHESLGALKDMVDEVWDEGTEDFPPTSFQISNIQSGTGALNVIPGFKKVHFNFRYSPAITDERLKARVEEILMEHSLEFHLTWGETSFPYATPGGELVEEAMASVWDMTKYTARPCTSGGTSDGRFVAQTFPDAQVVELGLINKSIHKINEHCPVEDLDQLARIYERLLVRILKAEAEEGENVEYAEHVDIKALP